MLKNITLSAEERLIKKAREKASREKKSLNVIFREWLERFVNQDHAYRDYRFLMKKLNYADAGNHFSRDELNER